MSLAMTLKSAEILFLIGVICLIGYLSTSSRRLFLKRVESAVIYLNAKVNGVISRRWYYLGVPVQVRGVYGGHTLVASFDLAQSRLVVLLRCSPHCKGGLLRVNRIADGVEQMGDRLIARLDIDALFDQVGCRTYLDQQLDYVAGLVRQVEEDAR